MTTTRSERLKQIQNGESENVIENVNSQQSVETEVGDNGFAIFLKIFGISIAAIGFIVGAVLGEEAGGYDFEYSVALVYWISGIVSGVFFLGFGVITQIVHEINERQKKVK